MPDYPAMYKTLFQSQTKAIRLQEEATQILIKAQQTTEEMYISSEPPDIRVLDTNKPNIEALKDNGAEASGEEKKDEI